MKIAVIGAGAVGGYYGARLASVGHDVAFVARGANLDALRASGLAVQSPLGDVHVRVRAERDASAIGPVELVIFAVKTYSNPDALGHLPPLAGPGTVVLTLQNGVDSAEDAAAVVGGERVLGGATYIIAALTAPGVVRHTGTVQRIVFGEAAGERTITARVAAMEKVLCGAGIQAEGVADARIPIWEKYLFLAPLAGLTAAARLPLGPLRAHAAFTTAYDRAMSEVEAIARAEGVPLAEDVRAQKLAFVQRNPPDARTSMMMDLVAGRPIEVEALLGSATRRGRAAGVPTPAMDALYAVLKPFEHGAAGAPGGPAPV